MAKQMDLMQGTLDLLILKAVSLGKLHGYGVLLRIQAISGERLLIQQGSLYPALYRLEHAGLLATKWGESENNRRPKYYSLTVTGRKQLEAAIVGLLYSTTRITSSSRNSRSIVSASPIVVE